MPAPLSNDMRIRIIKAREREDTIAQIAREKEVNQSTIVRLLRLYRETRSYEACPLSNGRKPKLSPEILEIIRERIERQLDTRFERTSILSSVCMDGTMVPLVFEGALNEDLFKAYVEHMLAPSLKPGDIVIMDNLSSHKVKGIAGAVEAVGASIMYLPPYSPDLNPIELLWSKVKAILRKLKIRTKDLMDHAISQALDAISLDDIAAWFRHDGYTLC
jgi:transposase/transposase-like protein